MYVCHYLYALAFIWVFLLRNACSPILFCSVFFSLICLKSLFLCISFSFDFLFPPPTLLPSCPFCSLPTQPDLLLAAVQSRGAAFAHVPFDLRGDPQLVLAAVAVNPAHLLLAPHALRGHRGLLCHLLTVCPLALAYTWPSVSVDGGMV